MRHDWIFDVLADLRVYADENNLPALAAQVTTALQVARLEAGAAATQSPPPLDAVADAIAEKRRRAH
ncbi:hypothetical protein SAMN05216227_102536 [Pseudorhodobacter antarcticus]|jgi:hypothetical protein|uniref:Uncharacterized protein n=1 Tax=Pseudorhodobacter antarcticus TaxID=1077947 RepID=A0A1H8JIP7_9RHOB|nr:hypothetical protein [Pseudorhodobacter antarcticus]SEN80078.1 hypothetical protein SAMN05216227_102536 [Pseudorhodobacter antarcticus]